MSEQVGSIVWVLNLDAKKFKEDLDETSKKTDGLGDKFRERTKDSATFGEKLGAVGDKAAAAGKKMSVGLTLPLAALGTVAFNAASDLNESMSKVDVVFGKQADAVQKWSKTSAESMGISQQAALEAASTYGNLFQSFGIGKKVSMEMSTSLVQLASDLASFNNANPTEVLDALRSGLSGETEPLKRFGIAINDARLQAEALRLGLVKAPVDLAKVEKANIAVAEAQKKNNDAIKKYGANSKEAQKTSNALDLAQGSLEKTVAGGKITLDQATKSQAAYSLVMQDTKLAQGDFGRTADGAANKLRIMKAQMTDAAATAGTALIPIVTSLATWVGKVAGKFSKLSEGQKKFIVILGLIVAAVGPVVTIFGKMAQAVSGTMKAYKSVVKNGPKVVEFVKKHGSAAAETTKKITSNTKSVTTNAAAKTAAAVKEKLATIATKAQTVATKAQTVATKLATIATKAWGVAVAFLTSPIGIIIVAIAAIVAILVVLYKKNEGFRKFVDKTWRAIAGFFVAAWGIIKNVISTVVTWIKKNWVLLAAIVLGPLALIIVAFTKYRTQTMAVFKAIWKVVKAVFEGIVAVIKWAWENVIQPIWTALKWYITNVLIPAWKLMWTAAKLVWAGIVAAVSWAWNNVIKPLWDLLIWYITTILIPIWQKIWQGVKTVWNAIATVISWAWNNVIKPLWDLIWAYVTTVLIPMWQKIWDIAKAVWEGIWNAISTAWGFISGVWQTIWDYITNTLIPIFQSIWDKVKAVWDGIWNAISSAITKIKGGFDKAKGFITDLIDAFKKIPDKILDVFKGAGKWLVDTGKDIIQGLIDGAGKLLSKLGKFFLDKVPGWIKGPFKSALGISSPSKVFAGYGKNINEGLAEGLKRTTPVSKAMDRLNALMTSGGYDMTASMVADASGITGNLSSEGGASASPSTVVELHYDGIITRSDAEFREVTLRGLELVNDWLRSQGIPEIGEGKIKGLVA